MSKSKSLLERTWAAASALITETGHPEHAEDRPTIVVDRALYVRLWETMHGAQPEPEPEPQYAVHKLMICADCALYHANGDLPEGRDLQGDIDRTWDGTGSVVRFSVDTGPGEEFSAARCGSCGSRLAGERHPATAIVFE